MPGWLTLASRPRTFPTLRPRKAAFRNLPVDCCADRPVIVTSSDMRMMRSTTAEVRSSVPPATGQDAGCRTDGSRLPESADPGRSRKTTSRSELRTAPSS